MIGTEFENNWNIFSSIHVAADWTKQFQPTQYRHEISSRWLVRDASSFSHPFEERIWRVHMISFPTGMQLLVEHRLGHSIDQNQIDGWVQDCSNSIANALDLLMSCTKPSIWFWSSTVCDIHAAPPACPRSWCSEEGYSVSHCGMVIIVVCTGNETDYHPSQVAQATASGKSYWASISLYCHNW